MKAIQDADCRGNISKNDTSSVDYNIEVILIRTVNMSGVSLFRDGGNETSNADCKFMTGGYRYIGSNTTECCYARIES